MQFEWDESKNKNNIKKHSVCFEDAIPVFFDEKALSFEDSRHNSECIAFWQPCG